MPSFNDLSSLADYLQKKIDRALTTNVAQAVKKEEQKNIKQAVYDAYTPSEIYERRGINGGGLGSTDNMESELTEPGTLVVTNKTPLNPLKKSDGTYFSNAFPSDYGLPEIIEYGNNHGAILNPPKPFMKNTAKSLSKTKALENALKNGLHKQGIVTD